MTRQPAKQLLVTAAAARRRSQVRRRLRPPPLQQSSEPRTPIMVQDGRSPFAAALRAIADRPGPLPEEEAQQFLQHWPLEAVFRCEMPLHAARQCLVLPTGACQLCWPHWPPSDRDSMRTHTPLHAGS